MARRLFLLTTFAVAAFVTIALADDEVTVRSKDKPYKGAIKSETSRGIEITGVKGLVPAEEIVDVVYELGDVTVRVNAYRPAVNFEKNYYDPDPKKEAQRKTNLTEAIKKYSEAYQKLKDGKDGHARRHIEYKLAVLAARQAQDEGGDLGPAIKRLSVFKTKHPNSWQIAPCLELLASLQAGTKQYADAEATYMELAKADVPEDTKLEAELMAAQISARAGKQDLALKRVRALAAKLPKGSKFLGRALVAEAECLAAAKKDAPAIALLRQAIKESNDKNVKALAYNTLGQCLYNGEHLKEARWEFLWVDVVYNQDKAEHAKALYYLAKIFDKLDEKDRAQECRDALVSERAFAGMEWQRQALKEAKAGP